MVSKLFHRLIGFILSNGFGGETARYVLVGCMTTLINYGIFELMWSVMGIDATICNVTSISVSVIFSYVANKLIVFRKRSSSRKELYWELLQFISARLFTVALEVGAVEVFAEVLGYNARLVKISAQVVVIIANYLVSKLLVFRSKERR